MSKMPRQRPWDSEQVVETPRDLLDAIESRWGKLDVDLACSRNVQCSCDTTEHGHVYQDNRKAPEAIVFPDEDALRVPWADRWPDKRCFVNPPFKLCGEFADKCLFESRRFTTGKIFLLTPASVGSNWFRDYVNKRAEVRVLNPRLTFVGHEDPYPKDMMLSVFSSSRLIAADHFDVWEWETSAMRARRLAAKVEDIDAL